MNNSLKGLYNSSVYLLYINDIKKRKKKKKKREKKIEEFQKTKKKKSVIFLLHEGIVKSLLIINENE